MEKIVNRLINESLVNVDRYNNNNSTWLIFTETKQWVIELTKDGTLWYNYNFFKNLFVYMSMDVVENQHYITKWVEDTIINGVKHTIDTTHHKNKYVEDAIQNGVKETHSGCDLLIDDSIEDTIQNGVKETKDAPYYTNDVVDTIIQNGVKHTDTGVLPLFSSVEDAIQNGVKHTRRNGDSMNTEAEDAIQNGVKETELHKGIRPSAVEYTIENGVKVTNVSPTFTEYCDWLDGDERLDEIIQNGIKETNPTNFAAVEDAIQNGVKKTDFNMYRDNNAVEDTIQNGVKYVGGIGNQKWVGKKVEDTIKNGIKETIGLGPSEVTTKEIEKVIKETKTPGEDGDILGAIDFMSDNNTNDLPQLIDDVIQNGIKETKGINGLHGMNEVIQNGVKETKLGAPDNRDYFIEDAIQNGVKHTEPGGYLGSIEMKGKIVHQLESPKQNEEVEYVIENGVKHTVCSSAPFVYGVKDTLQHGVKETFDETHHRRREVVRTIRDGIKETYDDAYHHKSRVDGVIKNGIKQTCAQIPSIQPVVERILEEGILQTKPMDEWVNTNRIVDKVMTESIKETLWMNGDSTNWGFEGDDLSKEHDKIDDAIKNGIKATIL